MTKEKSIHIRLPDKQLEDINKIAKDFNFMNRSEVIRYLLTIGIKYHKGLLKD